MEEKRTGIQTENKSLREDRVGIILMLTHILFLVLATLILIWLVKIRFTFEPTAEIRNNIIRKPRQVVLEPERGSILAHDGRLLAVSVPNYQIAMDCAVRRDWFRGQENAKELEAEWLEKARKLSVGLARIFRDKTADEYYRTIAEKRASKQSYLRIGHPVGFQTLQELKTLPLFNESSYKGGLIVDKIDTRQYPYGELALRTIGYVRNNSELERTNIGIEGRYNYLLHGEEGFEWHRQADRGGKVKDHSKNGKAPVNGLDIRTTLDVDIQETVTRELKARILERDIIEGGCAIVMEVETGAIRAMVNLKRNSKGEPSEIYNYAIGRKGDPGSVFKLATLMTLIEDNRINLRTMLETHKGEWTYNGTKFKDEYLQKWPSATISVIDAFKISSNNAFRELACKYYEENPKAFTDKLHDYKLTEAFDFDIKGLAKPDIVEPGSGLWSGTTLPSIAIGYTNTITPLHIVTFYNAVANRGKMMKPYLVEAYEKDGRVVKKFRPEILNGSICSPSTADTLVTALRAVVLEGTGRGLKDARCQVAGKTGTARIPFNENGRTIYKDKDDNRQHQATFVGFFPADAPKYTAILVMYSTKGKHNLYGAFSVPAYKNIVDEIFALDSEWGDTVHPSGSVPLMDNRGISIQAEKVAGVVPSVMGYGLSDAIYAIENAGYKCAFNGSGKVVSQSPSGGSRSSQGATVKIELK